jgi:gamma-glutamylcyclotransferase (GGCT)/AIG2-like uncharacterized protein YtfP
VIPYLFVYGTLLSACRNPVARRLAAGATLLGPARAPGRLYRLARYPALRPARGIGEWVSGEVYRLRNPWRMLTVLDDYEGALYRRVLAATDAGVRVWVYEYRRRVGESRRIPGGNWLDPDAGCPER